MENLLTYLESSSLVATVLTGISLGFIGVLTRAVLGMAREVVTGGKTIREQLNISERLNLIEAMIMKIAEADKTAVLGSSLTSENKAAVLARYSELDVMDVEYDAIVAKNAGNAEDLKIQMEQILGGFTAELEKVATVAPNESAAALASLREQLATNVEVNPILGTIMQGAGEVLDKVTDGTVLEEVVDAIVKEPTT